MYNVPIGGAAHDFLTSGDNYSTVHKPSIFGADTILQGVNDNRQIVGYDYLAANGFHGAKTLA